MTAAQQPPGGGPGEGGGYPPPGGGQQGYPAQQGGYPQQPGGPPPGGGKEQLASVGARIGAALIDILILIIPGLIIAAATGRFETTDGGFEFSLVDGAFLLQMAVMIAYFTIMEATAGGSVGKLAVGIRVVKQDFSPVDFGPALIRNIIRVIDVSFCFLIGLIMIAVTDRRQRLGDMAASTLVVRKEYVRG